MRDNPKQSTSDRIDAIAASLNVDTRDPKAIRKRIEALEMILERSIVIPGLGRPIGLDAVVGLIPVVGDIVTGAMGAYLIWEARNLGLPKWKIARMAGNLGVDTLLGFIPLAGDAFDFLFRSNSRNLKIVQRHLDRHHPETVTIDQ
ncbi:MAG: DUF4112 domain-containing protein [Sphingomonadales bacterium]|nr:DUF4112 domain-containing protein [Sphingomonadales bacterium]